MHRRRTRIVLVLAAAAAFAGGLALPASRAFADGPQLAANPSTNLDSGTPIQVTLSAADSYDGQTVY